MKRILLIIAVLAVAAGLSALSTEASAHKYRKMQQQTMQTGGSALASAEQNRSMTDCMQYSANFRSKGINNDKSMFKRQYGAPCSESGRTFTYNYDNYTNIVLNCSKGSCFTKCLGK